MIRQLKSKRTTILFLCGAFLWATLCGQPAAERARLQRLNNLGVAYMEQLSFEPAVAQFSEAIQVDPRFVAGHVNLGIAQYYQQNYEDASQSFANALRLEPNQIRAHYMLGLIFRQTNQNDQALESFLKVHQRDPADPSTNYYLGLTYQGQRQYSDAIRHLELAVGEQPYNASAYYNLGQAFMRSGEREKAREALATFQELRGQFGSETIGLQYLEQGKYSQVIDHPSSFVEVGAPSLSTNRFETRNLAGETPHTGTAPADLSYSNRAELESKIVPYLGAGASFSDFNRDGNFDIFVGGAKGDVRLLENRSGRFSDVSKTAGIRNSSPTMMGLWGDFDNDSNIDLYLINYGPNQLWMNQGDGTFKETTKTSQTDDVGWGVAGTVIDFDHDGDLDILVANLGAGPGAPLGAGNFPTDLPPSANVLYQNDGSAVFSDVSMDSGLASHQNRSTGVWITDFDNSRDIDVILSGNGVAGQLWSNLRNGSFQERASDSGIASRSPSTLIPADLIPDGQVDIVSLAGARTQVFQNQGNRRFRARSQSRINLSHDAGFRSTQAVDIDSDGDLDLVSVAGPRLLRDRSSSAPLTVLENQGGTFVDVTTSKGLDLSSKVETRGLSVTDYDRDGDLDLLVGIQNSLPLLFENQGEAGNGWVEIALEGTGSNRAGIGTKVEILAGSHWQKLEIQGGQGFLSQSPPVAYFGLGKGRHLDVVRLLWPGGVLQSEIDPDQNQVQELKELDRKGTSCPILYVWNGETYQFQTDFLGGSAFGALLAPDLYNYPDTDEYIKLDRDTLQLKDGRLAITLNNQLEEVIFFDALEVVVVDHSDAFEVYPDEKLLPGPPFNPFRILTSSNARPPVSAHNSEGKNVGDALSRIDRKYASLFAPLPYKGYANRHSLTLDLGSISNQHAFLLMHAWIDYADSTSNLAAQQAGLSLIPPYLQVEDKDGNWVTVIERMGFPAGLPKTMTVDLSGKFLSDSRKVRIITNMRIHWDQILVDDSKPSSTLELHRLKASSAELRFKGFPRFYSPDGAAPKVYDYDATSYSAPWKVHIGAYTRFGDVTPLLESPEDFYVVTRAGDEIEALFDVSALPALRPGWTRDYFVYVVGFGKDMDINSATPDYVGPLPFHGMPSYPYPTGSYPMDKAHREYLKNWNTRLVEEWLPVLPKR